MLSRVGLLPLLATGACTLIYDIDDQGTDGGTMIPACGGKDTHLYIGDVHNSDLPGSGDLSDDDVSDGTTGPCAPDMTFGPSGFVFVEDPRWGDAMTFDFHLHPPESDPLPGLPIAALGSDRRGPGRGHLTLYYALHEASGTPVLALRLQDGSSSHFVCSAGLTVPNSWHQVRMVIGGGPARMWVDEVPATSTEEVDLGSEIAACGSFSTQDLSPSTAPLFLGASNDGSDDGSMPDRHFAGGAIDEFRVYDARIELPWL